MSVTSLGLHPMSDADRKKLLNQLFKIDSWQYSKCLADPGTPCPLPAIRAHSVQNARSLDLLARDGHVVALTRRLDATNGPVIEFGDVGRNLATTFAGLCAQHDQTIFAPLDRLAFDPTNQEHLFLAGYRAVIREFYATCAAASKVQTAYLERVAAGLDPRDAPSPAGIVATEHMMKAYETYLYKGEWDEAYAARDFGRVQHDVIELNVAQPTIAASALFTVHGAERAVGDMVRAALTVLPISRVKTVAVFSYLPPDASPARAVLQPVLTSTGDRQKYELSRRILNSCENFVIAPAYFDTWTDGKKRVVREYFTRTILVEEMGYESPDLGLF